MVKFLWIAVPSALALLVLALSFFVGWAQVPLHMGIASIVLSPVLALSSAALIWVAWWKHNTL